MGLANLLEVLMTKILRNFTNSAKKSVTKGDIHCGLFNSSQQLSDFSKHGIIELIHVFGEAHVETNLKPHLNLVYLDRSIVDFENKELIKEIKRKIGRKVRFANVYP